MTKALFILLAFISTSGFGQVAKSDSTNKFIYEICVAKKARPGHIIKNEAIGIADTVVAFVSGQLRDKEESISFASISFTNSIGQVFGTISDIDGNYKIALKSDTYSTRFYALGYNEIKIQKLKLGSGQMQEIIVDLGSGSGFVTYEVIFDNKPTDKQLKAKEKELSGN